MSCCRPLSLKLLRYQPRTASSSFSKIKNTDHRQPKPLAGSRRDLGIAVVWSPDDGLCTSRGIAGLEDARADENAVNAKLYHQRRVGRRCTPRRRRRRKLLPVAATCLIRPVRPASPGRHEQLIFVCALRRRILAAKVVARGAPPDDAKLVPASLVRIIAAPSLMRRSASPRLRQPHTNA